MRKLSILLLLATLCQIASITLAETEGAFAKASALACRAP